MFLLDTNVCIDFLLGRSEKLAERIEPVFEQLGISAITLGELLVGSRTSSDPAGDQRRLAVFASTIEVLPFDARAAEAYGTVVRGIGVRRKSFDRLIGAHALALGRTLVTNDERDFADIAGLKVENWTRG
jgi:tRNA(fMet)-specific endonuclease VapC